MSRPNEPRIGWCAAGRYHVCQRCGRKRYGAEADIVHTVECQRESRRDANHEPKQPDAPPPSEAAIRQWDAAGATVQPRTRQGMTAALCVACEHWTAGSLWCWRCGAPRVWCKPCDCQGPCVCVVPWGVAHNEDQPCDAADTREAAVGQAGAANTRAGVCASDPSSTAST